MEARVALTLRTLAGLTTAEIARAFLVPEATMAKRLTRAKGKISNAGIPYRVPIGDALIRRTPGVLAVLYLLFNEGYSASVGTELVRSDLTDRAVELGRLVVELLPDDLEAKGLLALMLLHRARQGARVDENGDVVTLEDQDRSLWDQADISEGRDFLSATLGHGVTGPYQLQAAIAGEHVRVGNARDTDWATIVALYDELLEMTDSVVVRLNRTAAVAMSEGPFVALALLQRIHEEGLLRGYFLLPALRADLYRRLGERGDAAAAYREALSLVGTEPERRFLEKRLREVET
jgi:RNA polymerase sigma-70 factor (ECF subfamily)